MSNTRKTRGYFILAIVVAYWGLGILGLGVFFIAKPENFITDYFPWLKTEHPFFLCLIGFVGVAVGGFMAHLIDRDSQPIPNDSIPTPEPLSLDTNQAWRSRTNLRYLERLRDEYLQFEKDLQELYRESVTAHKDLAKCEGFLEYERLLGTISNNRREMQNMQATMSKLIIRIETIFAGDVTVEILDLEEELQELKMTRKERQVTAKQGGLAGAIAQDWLSTAERTETKLENAIRELKGFDFHRLYAELGVSPTAMRFDQKDLSSIKAKIDIVDTIKATTRKAQPDVVLSPQQLQDLERARLEDELDLAIGRKKRAVEAVDEEDEDMRRRTENMHNDRIMRLQEKISKLR
jgi:hypothetical protein